jgi:hypothetical protein
MNPVLQTVALTKRYPKALTLADVGKSMSDLK